MTDWLSATAMILSGAIVGFMFWYGMKGRAPKPDLERPIERIHAQLGPMPVIQLFPAGSTEPLRLAA